MGTVARTRRLHVAARSAQRIELLLMPLVLRPRSVAAVMSPLRPLPLLLLVSLSLLLAAELKIGSASAVDTVTSEGSEVGEQKVHEDLASLDTSGRSPSLAALYSNDTAAGGDDLEERLSLQGPIIFPEEDPDTCVDPNGQGGLCVEIKFCRQLRRIGLNNLRRYICGFQGSTPLLCCAGLEKPSPDSVRPIQPPQTPPVGPYPPPGGPQPVQPGTAPRPARPAFLPQDCGIGGQTNRIVGGRDALPGSYPWIIAVFLVFNNQKIHICGATLVSHRHVVSAAHCFFDGKNALPYEAYRMRLGDYDITRDDEIAGTLELSILGYKTHPGYVQKTYLNDLSLSYLERDVPFSKTIAPVCLPYTGFEGNLTNARAIVAGWGYTKYRSGSSNPILKETDIPVWSLQACATAFKNEVNITDDYLCAGDGEGKTDSCQGDSGGPLIMWGDDNRYYLMGVVSFGKRCATPGYPGAYTRITKQLEWLNNNF